MPYIIITIKELINFFQYIYLFFSRTYINQSSKVFNLRMYKETVIVYATCNIRSIVSKKCWMAINFNIDRYIF
jgi:hypothetical protein